MAVQFIQDLSNRTLSAFNNQEVIFRATGSEIPIHATITVGTASATITPDLSGRFHFNFKGIFKILVNQNHFSESESAKTEPGVGYNLRKMDANVFKTIKTTFSLEFEDGTKEEAVRQYYILRAVTQLDHYRSGLVRDNYISILLPYTDENAKTFHATMFDGYPFDIPLLLEQPEKVIIRNKRTHAQTEFNGAKGVNRVFLSSGISNVTLEDILPIADGLNEIEIFFEGDEANIQTLYLTKRSGCCGHLLKWFNDNGGWCYFLFMENKQELEYKEIADFPNNYGNIDKVNSAFTSLGYSKTKYIQLYADQLSREEKRLVNTIFGSPKVYLYLNPPFQQVDKDSWVEVKVTGSKITLETRYHRTYDFLFEISHPYQSNLTM